MIASDGYGMVNFSSRLTADHQRQLGKRLAYDAGRSQTELLAEPLGDLFAKYERRPCPGVREAVRGQMPELFSRKRKGDVAERITVYVPTDLSVDLRIHCAGHRLEMSTFITDAIRERLAATKGASPDELIRAVVKVGRAMRELEALVAQEPEAAE